MARLHTGRRKVLSRYRFYHGGTDTAVNITGDPRRWANDYGDAGVVHFFGPFLYRSRFYAQTQEQEYRREALAHLNEVIAMEGPGQIAAIILESVPGTAGIMVPPPGYLQGTWEICDRYGIMYIADEVMAGFGRTGKWFAVEHSDGVIPDLITFAKGVNSGYVPLGGVAISPHIAATFDNRPYPGGLTYSGHPLATAGGRRHHQHDGRGGHRRERRPSRNRDHGSELAEIAQRCASSVGEVRGIGMFWAIELVKDQATREPARPVRRHQQRRHERRHRRMQEAGPAAVRQLQPHPRPCRRSTSPMSRRVRSRDPRPGSRVADRSL